MQCGIGDQIIPLSQRAARQHIQVLASTYLMEVWIVTHSWATRRLNIISHNKRGGSHGQKHFLFFFHIREMTAWHQFVISMSFRKCKLNLVGFDIMKSCFFWYTETVHIGEKQPWFVMIIESFNELGILIYYLEQQEWVIKDKEFTDLPASLWWCTSAMWHTETLTFTCYQAHHDNADIAMLNM